mgnify:CR=1 FL=1
MAYTEADFLTLFVQLEAAPSWSQLPGEYRAGFHEWVLGRSDETRRILILEVDAKRIPAISGVWKSESSLHVARATLSSRADDARGVTYFVSNSGPSESSYCTWRRFEAEVVDPTRIPGEVIIPALSARQLRASQGPSFIDVEALSIHCASRSASVLTEENLRDWDARVIALTWGEKGATSQLVGQRLRSMALGLGYRAAGRGWGAAGSGELFVRTDSLLERLSISTSALRVDVGRRVVQARETVRAATKSHSDRRRQRLDNSRGQGPTLNYAEASSLVPIPVTDAIDLAQRVDDHAVSTDAGSPQVFDLHRERLRIDYEARRCHELLGVWPISFSHPRLRPLEARKSDKVISRIIPGVPYAFKNEDAYLREYSSAALALTHRKAGWDCFRHVEILAAGSVPLMPDIEAVPRFCMLHYPVEAMREVTQHAVHRGIHPSLATREAFRAYTQRFLTTQAMASYMLNAAGLQEAESVLFIDPALRESADYLSVLSLIGLKQLLGRHCVALPEVDYVFQDSVRDPFSLYGRGFGFSRVLDPECRSAELSTDTGFEGVVDSLAPDVIVIGSIARNFAAAQAVGAVFPMSKTIWLHGEDDPPSYADARTLRESGAHVFVRSIEPSGSPDRRSYAFAQSSRVW